MAKVAPASEHHLYRITFRRKPKDGQLTVRTRTYVTFGTDEDDAVLRVREVYSGSSFDREFDTVEPTVEFLIGGVLKVGGS